MHDRGDALLAAAVGAGDQHRHVGTGHLAGQVERAPHRFGSEHQPVEVVLAAQLLAPLTPLAPAAGQLAAGFGKLQQVLHRGQQLVVVPRLGQVVRGAGLDQLHRGFQVRPGGEQDHRQIGMALADRAEQLHTLLARGGVGGEVHVLDHHVDGVALQHGQAVFRRQRRQGADLVQRQRQRERLAHRGIVVDDEYGSGHSLSAHAGMDAAQAHKVAMTIGLCKPRWHDRSAWPAARRAGTARHCPATEPPAGGARPARCQPARSPPDAPAPCRP